MTPNPSPVQSDSPDRTPAAPVREPAVHEQPAKAEPPVEKSS